MRIAGFGNLRTPLGDVYPVWRVDIAEYHMRTLPDAMKMRNVRLYAYCCGVHDIRKLAQYVYCPVRKRHKTLMEQYSSVGFENDDFVEAFEYEDMDEEMPRFKYAEDGIDGIVGNCLVDVEHENLEFPVRFGGVDGIATMMDVIRMFHYPEEDEFHDGNKKLVSLCGRKNCLAIGHYRPVCRQEWEYRRDCPGCVECGGCGEVVKEYCHHEELEFAAEPLRVKCSHVQYTVCPRCVLNGHVGFDVNEIGALHIGPD